MSTLRVNTLQNTSTTDGGISINNSGHVTVDGVAMPSAGPLSNRNLIINGAMQVAQRGTSITADGYTALDRYYIYGDGTSTKTQESLSSGEPYNQGFRHFLRLTNTSVSSLTGGYKSIYQPVEAQNVAQSGWDYTSSSSYITLSFWVRSSVSQEFFGSIQTHDGTTQKYPFSLGTLAADTWTKVTKTIPGNSNIQVDNDTGIGLFVNIAPFWGTNYTDSSVSVDTWAAYSGSTRFPDMTSTWGTTNNATFDLTGVQLEVGSVATPFEHRSYGDELAKCQRYYEVHNAQLDIAQNGSGTSYGTWYFKQTKRDTTYVLNDASGTFTATNAIGTNAVQVYRSAGAIRITSTAYVDGEL